MTSSSSFPLGTMRLPPDDRAADDLLTMWPTKEELLDRERHEGVVVQWQSNGFGFIHFNDGRRAFVHNSACGGAHLQEGEVVTAEIHEDPKNLGKWCAHSVCQVPLEHEEGMVTEWNERGFGFITFSDRRAYVHNSACGGEHLVEGQRVIARVVEDAKNPGKWAAVDVQMVPVRTRPTPLATHLDRVEGVVTEWSEKGFGFVTLTDARRAYVHNSQCGGQHLQAGEVISCVVVSDPKNLGKWAAHNVERQADGEVGTVTEWHEEGGYGFVGTDDGRRAYIHRSSFGGVGQLIVGSRIQVTLKPDVRNPGKLCVADVQSGEAIMPEESGVPASVTPLTTHRDQEAHPLSGLDLVSTIVSQTQAAMAATPEETASSGVVTEWSPRGFGFLMMEDGRRAYVHNSQCGGEHLLQGEVVTAVLVPDAKEPGKWAAHQVKRDLSSLTSEDGVVLDWHEDGGYGFLQLEDGRRAYIHRSSFGGAGSLPLGARLRVIVSPDIRNPGKWSVAEVESCEASSLGIITGTEVVDAKRRRIV